MITIFPGVSYFFIVENIHALRRVLSLLSESRRAVFSFGVVYYMHKLVPTLGSANKPQRCEYLNESPKPAVLLSLVEILWSF